MRTTQQIENQIKVLEKKLVELQSQPDKGSQVWALAGKIAKLRQELKAAFEHEYLAR